MYLVDTCVLSEARRRSPPATAWLGRISREILFLSVMTLGEINKGIELRARRDRIAAAGLRRWMDELRTAYANQILPVDEAVAMAWGRFCAVRPRPLTDALIGATALAHGKILVTRNVADFADMGLEVLNPWTG